MGCNHNCASCSEKCGSGEIQKLILNEKSSIKCIIGVLLFVLVTFLYRQKSNQKTSPSSIFVRYLLVISHWLKFQTRHYVPQTNKFFNANFENSKYSLQ